MGRLDKKKIVYIESMRRMMGGGQHGLFDLVRSLNRRIFEPIVILQSEESPLVPLLKKIDVPVHMVRISNIPSRIHQDHIPVSYPFARSRLIKVFREIKPDLVHSNHYHAARYAAPAAKFLKIPHVTSIRSIYFDRFCCLNRVVEKRIFSNSDIICCNSSASKEEFKRRYPKAPIVTVRNAINTSYFKRDVDRESFLAARQLDASCTYLAYIAEIRPNNMKGHEDLISSLPYLSAKHPLLRILMIGGEAHGCRAKEKLIFKAAGLGVRDRVLWMKNQHDLSGFIKSSRAVVLATPKIEGLPRVVLECLACARPVVATDVGGVTDAVRNGVNGFLAKPGNPQSLAESIERMLDLSPDDYEQMCSQAFDFAINEFDISRLVKDYERIYLNLISNRSSLNLKPYSKNA